MVGFCGLDILIFVNINSYLMRNRKKIITAFIFFCSLLVLIRCNTKSQTYNGARIENEYKFVLPDTLADSVWKYLCFNYSSGNLFLKKTSLDFYTVFSEESFTDTYYDNDDLALLKNENGIRYRVRQVLSDTSNRKNNRELMQIKISSIGNNNLERAEYKYPIVHYEKNKEEYDSHPFLGLIKRSNRNEIKHKLKEFGIDALTLKPFIEVIQNRKRICINKGSSTVFGISLDSTSGKCNNRQAGFTELEVEINEIEYTKADSLTRKQMEIIIAEIKKDILKSFSSIKQDQTPKYNMAYNKLKAKYSDFDLFFSKSK